MMSRTALRRAYLIVAILFAIVTCINVAAAGGWRGDDSLRVCEFVEAVLILVWLTSDPGLPAAQRPSFDHALLLWISFPFLALYHQFVSRRWKGIATVFGLLLLLYAPAVVFLILLPVPGL